MVIYIYYMDVNTLQIIVSRIYFFQLIVVLQIVIPNYLR